MKGARIGILDLEFKRDFYQSIFDASTDSFIGVSADQLHATTLPMIDLLVCNDEFGSMATSAFSRLRERGIGVLHLIDGVLDWRNIWANPRSNSQDAGMPLLQPVLADCIACLGPEQARVLSHWGNSSIAITGMPRLDKLAETAIEDAVPGREKSLLAVSATSPGFTDHQVSLAIDGFAALASKARELDISIRWRVADPIADRLEVDRFDRNVALSQELKHVAAVVSQPSTCIMEAMTMGLPVASLDFTNSPVLVRTVWTLTTARHMDDGLKSLMQPTGQEIDLQKYFCREQMLVDGGATARVLSLIDDMLQAGRDAREEGRSFEMPSEYSGKWRGEPAQYRLAGLFPEHDTFQQTDLHRLQAELGHLKLANRQLADEMIRMKSSNTWRLAGRVSALLSSLRR